MMHIFSHISISTAFYGNPGDGVPGTKSLDFSAGTRIDLGLK